MQASVKFVFFSPIASKLALVQVMAYHRMGDKLLFEPMMIHVVGL